MNIKVSQSLMKSLNEYLQGGCGIQFKARYVTKTITFEPSEAMELGMYFEYISTGSVPRSGIPIAKYDSKGKLKTEYENAKGSAQLFNALIKYWGIEILEINYTLETDKMKGLLDLLVLWNGVKCIIDLKYSGMLYDKWTEFGWHPDFLEQKDNILVQGVHYKLLAREQLGIHDIPFYFWVFDAKNPVNVRVIEENVSELKMQQHIEAVEKVKAYIEDSIQKDNWIPRPNLLRCSTCPLREECEHRAFFPLIETVNY